MHKISPSHNYLVIVTPCQCGATSQAWPACSKNNTTNATQQCITTHIYATTRPCEPQRITTLEARRLTIINRRTNNAQLHQTHLLKGISLLYNQQTLTGLEQYSTKFSYDVMKTICFLAMSRGKARGRIIHPTTPGRSHPSLKIIHH